MYPTPVFFEANVGIRVDSRRPRLNSSEPPEECCMKPSLLRAVVVSALTIGAASTLSAQPQSNLNLRAPATPLVVHDPYFSIWSNADSLTGGPTRHWTGTRQELTGIVRIDGKNFRYHDEIDAVPTLQETQRTITPTRTIGTVANQQIELQLCSLTPAFPEDMAVMARPV